MKQLIMVCLLVSTVAVVYWTTHGSTAGTVAQLQEESSTISEKIENMSP